MDGPWEAYQTQSSPKPWERYAVAQEDVPVEEDGFVSNVKRDLANRFNTAVDLVGLKDQGKISAPEAALGMVGRVGMGAVNDLAANAIGSGLSTVNDLTGGYVGDKLSNIMGGLASVPTSTSEGTVGGEAIRGVGALADKYEQFTKDHPRATNIIESVGNIAFGAPLIKAATPVVKGGAKATITGVKAFKKPALMNAKELGEAYTVKRGIAEQLGGTVKPEFSESFISQISSKLPQTELGKAVSGESPITSLLERLQSFKNKPLSFDELTEADEMLGKLAYDTADEFGKLSSTGHKYQEIQHTLRNMLETAPEEMFMGGKQGFEAAKDARKYWAAKMRMRDIERVLENAEFYPQPSTRIQTGMRQLLQRKDSIYRSAAEIKAMKEAARTGALTGLMKVFGSGLGPTIAAGGGFAAGGPLGFAAAIPAYALQSTARGAANTMQMSKGKKVLEAIAGSVQDTRRPITRSIQELAQKTGKTVKGIMNMKPTDVKKLMGVE